MSKQLSPQVIRQLKGMSYEEKMALAAEIQGSNKGEPGVNYNSILRYIKSNSFILTMAYNQDVIRKHLGLEKDAPILATFKGGKWVADTQSEKEVAA